MAKDVPGRFFMYLGRLESRKNLLFLVEAFAKGKTTYAEMIIMGPVERGYDREIMARAEALGVASRVKILPPVYDQKKWGYLKHALAVIYPTVDEPFGRVPFEAVAIGGVPVIPDASGGAEYLKRFVPACVYKNQNIASLTETLDRLGQPLPQALKIQLNEAREWVRRDLDWARIAQRVLSLYESAIKEQRKEKIAAI